MNSLWSLKTTATCKVLPLAPSTWSQKCKGVSLTIDTRGRGAVEIHPMPRQLRLEYAGATYHIMSRGNRREAIFKDDRDREGFLRTLQEACQKTGWQVHAWCLM